MSLLTALPAAPSNVQNRIIDVVCELQGLTNAGSQPAERWVNRALRVTPEGTSGTTAHAHLTGGVLDIQRDAASQVRTVRQTSGAGTRTTGIQNGAFIPSGVIAGAAGGPTPLRPLRRYTAEEVIRWTVRGTAIIECGLVFGNGFLTLLGTEPAFVLSSDPGVNGGAYTPRVRFAPAGPITTMASTGVLPNVAGWERVGCRYTEGPSPLLELLLGGVPVAQTQGAGALPVNSSGSFFSGQMGYGCSAIVGTTVERAYSRYFIEEIGDG